MIPVIAIAVILIVGYVAFATPATPGAGTGMLATPGSIAAPTTLSTAPTSAASVITIAGVTQATASQAFKTYAGIPGVFVPIPGAPLAWPLGTPDNTSSGPWTCYGLSATDAYVALSKADLTSASVDGLVIVPTTP